MHYRPLLVILSSAFVLALAACGGGGGSLTGPIAPTNPTPSQGDQVSLSDVGVPQSLASVAGYSETITVPHNNGSGKLSVVPSLSLPAGTPSVPSDLHLTTLMLSFAITPANTVTFSGGLSFSIAAPTSVQLSGAVVEFAYYDPANGWQPLAEGTISGQTIALSSVSGIFTMQAGRTYVVLAYSQKYISGCPTPSPSPTPTPKASPTPTPTPTAAPTATPTSGGTTCTAPVAAVPGNYLEIFTEGSVVGSTYTNEDGDWDVAEYATPTPTPHPVVTPTPTPTPVGTSTPTPVPTPTPTPVMVTIYYGDYSWPMFTGTSETDTGYTVSANSGCFDLLLEQAPGGTAGQIARPQAASTPNAEGDGEPNSPTASYEYIPLDAGSLTALTINDLTPTGGSGTFSFSTATSTNVTGSITITGSETFTGTNVRLRRFLQRMDAARRRTSRAP